VRRAAPTPCQNSLKRSAIIPRAASTSSLSRSCKPSEILASPEEAVGNASRRPNWARCGGQFRSLTWGRNRLPESLHEPEAILLRRALGLVQETRYVHTGVPLRICAIAGNPQPRACGGIALWPDRSHSLSRFAAEPVSAAQSSAGVYVPADRDPGDVTSVRRDGGTPAGPPAASAEAAAHIRIVNAVTDYTNWFPACRTLSVCGGLSRLNFPGPRSVLGGANSLPGYLAEALHIARQQRRWIQPEAREDDRAENSIFSRKERLVLPLYSLEPSYFRGQYDDVLLHTGLLIVPLLLIEIDGCRGNRNLRQKFGWSRGIAIFGPA